MERHEGRAGVGPRSQPATEAFRAARRALRRPKPPRKRVRAIPESLGHRLWSVKQYLVVLVG